MDVWSGFINKEFSYIFITRMRVFRNPTRSLHCAPCAISPHRFLSYVVGELPYHAFFFDLKLLFLFFVFSLNFLSVCLWILLFNLLICQRKGRGYMQGYWPISPVDTIIRDRGLCSLFLGDPCTFEQPMWL